MKETIVLFLIATIGYIPTFGQKQILIEEITNKCRTIDQISFQSFKEIDPSLHSIDSVTFSTLFGQSKLLQKWCKDCCFYYGIKQAPNREVNLIIVERAGHYRPYLVLAVVDNDLMLVDELMLANLFVDAGEALEISSTFDGNKIEQTTLDYNIGYEPFFKEIKSTFSISDKGKIEQIERKEEMKMLK